MIEEDFERLSILDQMYLLEREREIADEWMQWEEEQEKKKSEIVMQAVIKVGDEPKLQKISSIQTEKLQV